ncbi:MAG: FG-GAP-like repeat-containing protein [Aequorivita sp.]
MIKTTSLLSVIAFGLCSLATAQQTLNKASLQEDGSISVETITLLENYFNPEQSQVFNLLWRFGRPANPTFKNTRGVTLADLNNDGIDEILYGIDKKLFILNGDGSIFLEKSVSGTIILPPTVADLDGDGNLEIAFNTGGSPNAGRVYLLDNTGNDLPGWPLNFENHWMINAPAAADVDGDGILDIVTGERVSSDLGRVHAVKMDGSPINSNWPVEINATPGFTPSIGDVNGDGTPNVVIAASKGTMYVFDNQGQVLPGFPVANPNISYSYQSPILADLNGNGFLEIIGSNHGDAPGFYVMQHDGNYKPGWPIAIGGWTYSPSTVLDVDGDGVFEIFMSDRNTSSDGTPLPTIYGFDPDGNNLNNFPIEKYGGTEGVLSIADVNDDGVLDIIFPSVMTDQDGYGFIHAFSLDGSGQVDGFPLRPWGYTFMNGAVLGDVDNDGLLDLTANSYTLTFGAGIDSTFVNVYNLNVPYKPENIKRNGYKGDNTRAGFVALDVTTGISDYTKPKGINIFPNPSNGQLSFSISSAMQNASIRVYDLEGRIVYSDKKSIENTVLIDLNYLQTGMYIVVVSQVNEFFTGKWIRN